MRPGRFIIVVVGGFSDRVMVLRLLPDLWFALVLHLTIILVVADLDVGQLVLVISVDSAGDQAIRCHIGRVTLLIGID